MNQKLQPFIVRFLDAYFAKLNPDIGEGECIRQIREALFIMNKMAETACDNGFAHPDLKNILVDFQDNYFRYNSHLSDAIIKYHLENGNWNELRQWALAKAYEESENSKEETRKMNLREYTLDVCRKKLEECRIPDCSKPATTVMAIMHEELGGRFASDFKRFRCWCNGLGIPVAFMSNEIQQIFAEWHPEARNEILQKDDTSGIEYMFQWEIFQMLKQLVSEEKSR